MELDAQRMVMFQGVVPASRSGRLFLLGEPGSGRKVLLTVRVFPDATVHK
jgi:hypothetical protein